MHSRQHARSMGIAWHGMMGYMTFGRDGVPSRNTGMIVECPKLLPCPNYPDLGPWKPMIVQYAAAIKFVVSAESDLITLDSLRLKS